MKQLSYTLVADGNSDQALMPILTWLLRQHLPEHAIQPAWAALDQLPKRLGSRTLPQKMAKALELFPCDLLFVHRDAEAQSRASRLAEVQASVAAAAIDDAPVICVIPVRMQEAWLLFDEPAIRRAAGNPNGREAIDLPPLARLEQLPNPKDLLHSLIREASGLHGRRRTKFHASAGARLVSGYIDDFAPLRALPAFSEMEAELQQVLVSRSGKDSGGPAPSRLRPTSYYGGRPSEVK